MNILEEIAEDYTYNGGVNLKMLSNDISTLENFISFYGLLLREPEIRNQIPQSFNKRIRDAKSRLSLLKAVYKKENNKTTSKSSDIQNAPELSDKKISTEDAPFIDYLPPTIEDYTEKVDGPKILAYDTDNGKGFESVEVFEDPILEEKDKDDLKPTYESPQKDEDRIYVSFDLSPVTNKTNTSYVTGTVIPEKKLLRISFIDLRDYEIFYSLIRKREKERCNFFKLFRKKYGSIFMTVTRYLDGIAKDYEFEFTECRIIETEDTPYIFKTPHKAMNLSDVDGKIHNCQVTFKYKKLKTR